MAVETDDDLAGMFDADEFAEPATYTAPGGTSATPCSVVVDRGQGRRPFDAGSREIVGSERKLWARTAELAQVARGGTFVTAAGETFAVAGMPVLDQTGKLWSVDLTILD